MFFSSSEPKAQDELLWYAPSVIYLSVRPSVRPPVRLSIHLSTCPSIHTFERLLLWNAWAKFLQTLFANQFRRENTDVVGDKPVKNDAGEMSMSEDSKQKAWLEHYQRLLNVGFDWDPDHLSYQPPVEGPPIPITIDMVKKAISQMNGRLRDPWPRSCNHSWWSRPWWLSWMRRPTGDQEVTGSTPAEVGNILLWRLIMKYFLRSFSPFRWFKKGSCQFLAKECAQYWLTA